MTNNFWLYFLITPVVVSILALKSLYIHKIPSKPIFKNALEHCQSEDNNYVYSDQGTAQDICIDEYMNAPWSVDLVIKIFLLFGFIFIVPILLHLNSTRKNTNLK